MTKLTASIRFGLTPELLDRIRTTAEKRRVSVSELIRAAVTRYLDQLDEDELFRQWRNRQTILSSLKIPVAILNPSEEERADKVMKQFRDEDRHNLP
jgi:Arc/MetJ-type ribon-helix-helix transcriptional regulator